MKLKVFVWRCFFKSNDGLFSRTTNTESLSVFLIQTTKDLRIWKWLQDKLRNIVTSFEKYGERMNSVVCASEVKMRIRFGLISTRRFIDKLNLFAALINVKHRNSNYKKFVIRTFLENSSPKSFQYPTSRVL